MIVPWLPLRTRVAMFLRLLTVQGSYNYETMIGNGIAFALEPALRQLPGGVTGAAYREAMSRESRYFNAHPYFASVAVGALARAELALDDPAQIERFRTAACGPLGGVGDRLVWAAWLPFCALLALLAYGLGASAAVVVGGFLVLYNAGHLALRAWGLNVGWRDGLAVAPALGAPWLRFGPSVLARAMCFAGGVAIPLVVANVIGARPLGVGVVVGVGVLGTGLLAALGWRVAGWRAATGLLALATLFALVAR